jgi:UDP-glucose 4-epimerase
VNLLEVMQRFEVNKMIFSSSASVYGAYDRPVREDDACSPEHPYGASKSIIERMLSDLSHAEDFRFVALRYFNAAGADPSGLIGQSTKSPTHIIECALRTASGDLPELSIYGTDYPTPDGTCVRDYVHVNDIADAHILALEYLWRGGKSEVFNVGYGHGNSVREVVDMAHKVTGIDFTVIEAQRRDGDYPYLVADSRKIKDVLGWNPKYDSLETIIKTAWDWTRKESERKNHGTISR